MVAHYFSQNLPKTDANFLILTYKSKLKRLESIKKIKAPPTLSPLEIHEMKSALTVEIIMCCTSCLGSGSDLIFTRHLYQKNTRMVLTLQRAVRKPIKIILIKRALSLICQPFNSTVINWDPSSHLLNSFDGALVRAGLARGSSWEPQMLACIFYLPLKLVYEQRVLYKH